MNKIGMNKRGVGAGILALSILMGFALVGGVLYFALASTVQDVNAPKEITDKTDSNFCANNPAIDVGIRAKDSGQATARYGDVTTAWKDTENGKVVTATIGNSAAFDASANLLNCGRAYDLFVLTDNNTGVNGQYVGRFTANVEPLQIDVAFTNNTGRVNARVYDKDAAAYTFGAAPNNAAAGTFYALNNTATVYQSNVNATAKTIAADGELRYRIDLQMSAADAAFGIKSLLGLDYADDTNTDDWSTPIISVNGVQLSNMKASLHPDSILALSAYEEVYDLGFAVDEVIRSVDVQMKSGSGVNPDFDPRFRVVGTAIIQSNKDPNLLVGAEIDESKPAKLNTYVAFSDATAREQLVSGTGSSVGTLDIS